MHYKFFKENLTFKDNFGFIHSNLQPFINDNSASTYSIHLLFNSIFRGNMLFCTVLYIKNFNNFLVLLRNLL
jgi:hypothetical protein